jgi:hypothetical protein
LDDGPTTITTITTITKNDISSGVVIFVVVVIVVSNRLSDQLSRLAWPSFSPESAEIPKIRVFAPPCNIWSRLGPRFRPKTSELIEENSRL